jgi:elongation factor Ts
MNISAKDVKELREKTGAGMMDCKKALTEAQGDFEKAVDIMREKGLARVAKRSGRSADEGTIHHYLSDDCKIGAMIELNCETDFVARTDEFQTLADKLCQIIVLHNPEGDNWTEMDIDGETAGAKIGALSSKLGEKIEFRRYTRYEAKAGVIDVYIHGGGKLGVMIEVESENSPEELKDVVHDLAMQIAAANPTVTRREEVSAEMIEKELDIYRAQARNEGKPEKVIERIATGKIDKFYSEVCLLEQAYVKEPKIKVSDFLAGAEKEKGIKINPVRFERFMLGGN